METPAARRRFLARLALAQFICSFAGSNMNVMINDITEDLAARPSARLGGHHDRADDQDGVAMVHDASWRR